MNSTLGLDSQYLPVHKLHINSPALDIINDQDSQHQIDMDFRESPGTFNGRPT